MPLSLTRLVSPHRTSRDASYRSHIPCGSADGISVAFAVVGSPRIPSIRRTPLGVALELTIGAAFSPTQWPAVCPFYEMESAERVITSIELPILSDNGSPAVDVQRNSEVQIRSLRTKTKQPSQKATPPRPESIQAAELE